MNKFFIPILCLITALLISNTAAAARQPIVVLQKSVPFGLYQGKEESIWKMGGSNPAFVLYDDGLVIFKKPGDDITLFSAQLSEEHMNDLLARFKLSSDFAGLEESYDASRMLDQPVFIIRSWQDGHIKTVRVFGDVEGNQEARDNTPSAFLKILDQMASFDPETAQPYEPEFVELYILPYTDAEGEPVAWPEGWADLEDARTTDQTKTVGHEGYNIYLAGEHKEEFEKLLAGLNEKQAVLMNERKWYVSPYRYCLPSEELWED